MAFTEFGPLDEKSLIEYIKAVPSLYSKFGDDLKAKEVRDGNLNFVYIVVNHCQIFSHLPFQNLNSLDSVCNVVSGHICILIVYILFDSRL